MCADLLICVHKDERVFELVLFKNGMELIPRGADALCVAAVHNIDDSLCQTRMPCSNLAPGRCDTLTIGV